MALSWLLRSSVGLMQSYQYRSVCLRLAGKKVGPHTHSQHSQMYWIERAIRAAGVVTEDIHTVRRAGDIAMTTQKQRLQRTGRPTLPQHCVSNPYGLQADAVLVNDYCFSTNWAAQLHR